MGRRRRFQEEARRKQEEEKRGKLQHLTAKDPNTTEILHIREMKSEQDRKKKAVENAQLQRELASEKAAREAAEKQVQREELWERLEVVRRERSVEREARRIADCV